LKTATKTAQKGVVGLKTIAKFMLTGMKPDPATIAGTIDKWFPSHFFSWKKCEKKVRQ
jgi:hypothetical protein